MIRFFPFLCILILPSIIPAQIWVVRYNGLGNGADEASAIAVDNVGNIYVTGDSYDPVTSHDYATVKYSSSGVEQWVARYNGPINYVDFAFAVAVDSTGNVYITGDSYSSITNPDYVTVKYDSSGIEQWVVRYDGPANGYDHAHAIAIDNAGNVYVTGWSYSTSTLLDITTVKYDSSGIEQWVARHDGPMNSWDYAYAIAVDTMGYIYVAGESAVSDTFCDYATVKYDASGIEQWVARYNGLGSESDQANGLAVDNAGNVYVTGSSRGFGTSYDYATVKYDSSGVEQWVARYDGPGSYSDEANAIAIDNAGDICITGSSYAPGTKEDYATIKYSATGLMEYENTIVKKETFMTTIFRGALQLPEGKRCKVYDITGRLVEPEKIAPGIYFVEVDNEIVQKFVRIK